jgi:competence protein ComEC
MIRRSLSFVGLLGLAAAGLPAAELPTVWTMLNVTPAEGQADCHLLRLPDGRQVLVDPADAWDAPGAALAGLKQLGVTHLDLVVISHFHKDHYGRLLDLLRAGIVVERIALNVPDKSVADREIPWGCDWDDVQAVLAELRARHVTFFTPKAGDRLIEAKGADGIVAGLDVVCCYDGVNTPAGVTDVNDTSIVLRFFHGPTRVLFTGDLNRGLGGYLAGSTVDLRADLLKVPHHGTEMTVGDEFFDRVGARAAFVPSPKALWESPRSLRIRNYFADRKIPAFVSGLRGRVTVTITSTGYVVETER